MHRPDLTNTFPPVEIGPFAQWASPDKIVSIDPWGHLVAAAFADELAQGYDIRPTIAITKARIGLPELREALAAGRLRSDNRVLLPSGDANVVKAAIEPVWYLPGIAKRLGIGETALRRALFHHTGAMFPDLITRPDLKVFLPPIGNITLYIFGDIARLWDNQGEVACRVHDECNGSDVFGSDICTCRPYLTHGIEECIRSAQTGGAGLIVYNARKRNPAGDSAAAYFERTECVAGVQDMRFQDLMPDVFHWLGITRIDRWLSMSNMKFDAMAQHGITIGERVALPEELIPADARVEIDAKKAAGYFSTEALAADADLGATKGRELDKY